MSEHVIQAMDRVEDEGEGGGRWGFVVVVSLRILLVAEVN